MNSISHSIDDYERLVDHLVSQYPYDIAMYRAIGCSTYEDFKNSGDGNAAVLKYNGLRDGMSIYDLGCGSGRTAQALIRMGWTGNYKGADIIARLVNFLKQTCPGYEAHINKKLTILAADNSLDMIFHWSVFTHLFIKECYAYLEDIKRALKPGGRLVFSFLELENESHRKVFKTRVAQFKSGQEWGHLDTFIHKDWIRLWANEFGFTEPKFTEGTDATSHPSFWQTLVSMDKPG